MSEAIALLNDLRERGLRVTIAGPNLRIVPKVTDPALIERLRARKAEVMALLTEQAETARIVALDAERHARDRQARRGYDHDSTAPSHGEWVRSSPAAALIRTCREYNVALRVDSDGTLVVGPGAWRSLVGEIEAHVDDIIALLESGYDGCDA
jgi:hypothetical protein